MGRESINRDEFDRKIKELFTNNASNSRSMWDRKQYENVKSILMKGKVEPRPPKAYYNFRQTYEIFEVSENECHLIKARKNQSDKIVYVIPFEDYYDRLLEAHVQTGHGGRDRMLYYIKNRWKIARSACEVFLSCCETCNLKKCEIKKGVVVKPIVSQGFNARGQVDLIDFQSCADNEYNWLLVYQDHATKFVQLRPLKSEHAANVADELCKIFFTFGAPNILQSDNGREFVAKVIEVLVNKWPHCKIVHGGLRNPKSEGSVERGNSDIENMLRAWMIDRKSTKWSEGCYEVQWLKNTSKHRIINRTSYEAVLGPIHYGLYSLSLPDNVVNNLHTEEELEKALSELKQSVPEQSPEKNRDIDMDNGECSIDPLESSSRTTDTASNDFPTMCVVCNRQSESLICSLCVPGMSIIECQKDCFEKHKVSAVKMDTFSEETFKKLTINDCVTLSVPEVDRGPLNLRAVFGVVTDFRDGVYQIGTKHGLIKGWFPRNQLNLDEIKAITFDDVPKEVLLTLREAVTNQSVVGGQEYQKCSCKANQKQCKTSRCSCFK